MFISWSSVLIIRLVLSCVFPPVPLCSSVISLWSFGVSGSAAVKSSLAVFGFVHC